MKKVKRLACINHPDTISIKAGLCKETHKLALDHNHKTGKLREFLCFRCNMAVGYARDSIKIINSIKKYLKKHD